MSNTDRIISIESYKKKFRLFSKNISWKKSLTFFFFLLLATVFWIIHVYSQKIEIKLSIPIKYTNIADNILFEHELPTQIDIHLQDYGSSILQYNNISNDSLEIDMGSIIKESTSRKTFQGQAFEQLIKSKLQPSSELISFSPTYISCTYSTVSTKKLPVLFDGVVNLATGYQLDGDISLYPDSVTAYGTKNSLDTLRYAYTTKDTIRDIRENKKTTHDLITLRGVTFKPNRIQLNVPVDEFIIKTAKVPIECINIPKDLNIRFFPPEAQVSFSVGRKRYNLIQSSDFKIILDYEDLKKLSNSTVPLRIIDAPDFVRTRIPDPSEVEFILEKNQ